MRHGEACITQPRRVANQSSNCDMLVDDGDVAANSPSKPNRADHRAAGRRQADFWHLDEMVVRIAGKRMYLWRAVDHEGEVLDMLVQSRHDRKAAVRLMRKLLRKQSFAPRLLVTDKLGSYGAAFRQLGLSCP